MKSIHKVNFHTIHHITHFVNNLRKMQLSCYSIHRKKNLRSGAIERVLHIYCKSGQQCSPTNSSRAVSRGQSVENTPAASVRATSAPRPDRAPEIHGRDVDLGGFSGVQMVLHAKKIGSLGLSSSDKFSESCRGELHKKCKYVQLPSERRPSGVRCIGLDFRSLTGWLSG